MPGTIGIDNHAIPNQLFIYKHSIKTFMYADNFCLIGKFLVDSISQSPNPHCFQTTLHSK